MLAVQSGGKGAGGVGVTLNFLSDEKTKCQSYRFLALRFGASYFASLNLFSHLKNTEDDGGGDDDDDEDDDDDDTTCLTGLLK